MKGHAMDNIDAKTPKTSNLEIGTYKDNHKAGNSPNKADYKPAPKPASLNAGDNVPARGFKDVSVSRLEVGKYKSNPNAGDTPNK